MKSKYLFLSISMVLFFSGCLSDNHLSESYVDGWEDGYRFGQEELNNTNMEFWLDQESESQRNFEIMRDIFTCCNQNDTVTIMQSGYYKGGYSYWVNHSMKCNSYFFDDSKTYLVYIPMFGEILVDD